MSKFEALVSTAASLLLLASLLSLTTFLPVALVKTAHLLAHDFAHLTGCLSIDLLPLIVWFLLV